jgi:formylglycine-generating enzyme required for sulfatase activity
MDRYEASLVEVTKAGPIHHSPYEPVGARHVRAISEKGRTPQAYISRNEAQQACRRAGKRLCTTEEWVFACKGRNPTTFPYGATRKIGYCNDAAPVSPLDVVFGNDPARHQRDRLNDPRLNRVPRTLAKSGAYERCKNGFGVFDLVGNLHEWVDDPSGKFRGGYYLDSHENGDGCDYVTVAHGPDYHDYSTGFRCCAAPGGRSGRKGG